MALFKKTVYSHIIVGLGNIGPKYMNTRHNVGFLTLDLIVAKYGGKYTKKRFHALSGEILIAGKRILVLKPETFMNNSGISVGEAASFYKIPSENIIVISDDINLPVGKMRIKKTGSAGGHNGLKSIIEHLGSENFPRIRIGIGDRENGSELADYVLGVIPEQDMELLKICAENSVEAVALITDNQTDKAMNKYN